MNVPRRAVWITVALVAALILSAVWFLDRFERETYETRTPALAAARRDPWLAAERLLQALGWRVEAVQEATSLDELPPRGALILSNEREYHLTPTRTATLLAWIDDGGYLIADASGVAPSDPLLRAFDVQLMPRRTSAAAPALRDRAEPPRPRRPATSGGDAAKRAVGIPGYGRVLHMRAGQPLYAGDVAPLWRVPGPNDRDGTPSDEMLEFARGQGRVTLVNGLWRFRGTQAVAEEDHAEILAALLAAHGAGREVRILSRLSTPTLFQWLRDNAAAALASAGVLLLFWLWRIVPRFGVVRPPPARERRSLVQHLRAMGRFLWRARASRVLLDAARANVRRRLAQRGITAADAPLPDVCVAVERAFGIPAAASAQAFGGSAHATDEFTTAMATLATLDHRLDDSRIP